MSNNHFSPKLRKRLVLRHLDYTVYSVNGFAVRNVAQPDEEFGNFATRQDFAKLIPKGELWLSEKTAPKEAVFFIANALTQLREQDRGAKPGAAYDAGLEAEQALRESVNGVQYRDGKPHQKVPNELYQEHYTTLPDEKYPVDVWVIDGNQVRSLYKTDYTEGGHGYVYPWVPKQQIWIDDGVDRREVPFIVSHEYLELRLMRDVGLDYDKAHDICSAVEFRLRKRQGIHRVLVPGRRKLHKSDLPRLTQPEALAYVVKHHVQ